MEIPKLISLSDARKFCKISAKFDIELFNQILLDSQENDLRPLLGNELYNDLINDIDNDGNFTKYSDLMDGCKYTFKSNNYHQLGLRIIISKFVFARILKDPSAASEYGYINPTNDWSNPSPDKIILRNIQDAESSAVSYWEMTKLCLMRNIKDYPLFRVQSSQPPRAGIQIVAVGGNSASLKKQFGGGDIL
jgi:hypothetical protein